MTTYSELHRERMRARPLFLEAKALGLDIRVKEHPEREGDYRIGVKGLRSLSPTHRSSLEQRIKENKPGLIRLLMMGKWDEDLHAVLEESRAL